MRPHVIVFSSPSGESTSNVILDIGAGFDILTSVSMEAIKYVEPNYSHELIKIIKSLDRYLK